LSDLLDALTPQLTIAGLDPLAEAGGDEERYRELVENANDVVYAHDLDGNFTSVNKAIHSLTGYTREEVLRFNLKDLLTGESHEVARQMIAGKLGGEVQTPYEVTVRGKDGTLLALEVSTRLLFRLGKPVGVLGIARDVSDRRRAEGHLRLLRSVVVNANDAVLIAQGKPGDHLGGKIVYVNEAFTRMTGHSPEDAVGRTPRILLGPLTSRDQLNQVRDALARKQAVRVEMINYRKDGSAYWVDVNFVPITEASGEFTHWVAVQRETTERKRAEDLERDRNRVLEMVARNGELETILNHLAAMVERQCPDLRCSVLLLRNGELVPVAGAALSSEAVRGFQDLNLGALLDPVKSGRLSLSAPRPTTGSGWSVPILSASGATLGAFAGACSVQRKPLPEELGLISKSGQLAAIAIEQRQLADKLAYQAQHDALTGLPNRALFEDRLHRALAQARRQGWMAAVLFVDLDRFKQINDTLGHSVGDLLLQQVAHRLEGCIRRSDTLARMGGDEFTVLLTELHDQQFVLAVAQKLLDALHLPFQVDTFELFVTASIGVSVYPRDGKDAATLQRNADSAMYCAKNRGKNNFQLFAPKINASALESLEIENALRRALENDEFQLRYQPQVSIDGGLTGLEALLVWNHPKLGIISPRQFIPVAEECGLIVPIGSWVLKQACTHAKEWRRAGFPPVKVAVNVSVTQFMRAGFADSVDAVLKETGFDAGSLELELTEGVVMNNVEESNRQMRHLRSLGVSLALDDFGTGYSSLSYLRNLPIDTLKIDQSFLEGLDSTANALPLLKAIVVLAHSLSLCVVAEGVETSQQLEALRQVGCDRVQGYLTGEPVSAEGVTRLLGDPRSFSSFSAPPKDDPGKKPRRRIFFPTN
jgi:diguanylate cyclase (GGDEF)-like protein/PAS domain S-box-containing protein